ncbi:hypothetical protein TIFTF001_033037 [Ficus carica]|uniref:Uncharacterized protein n=1 Tax=Ficus carica TaxID=3494 RepID=A0AA88DYD9_FICCA|nr:hypothetical protein TIFTF001_033037 [Ficus carica]
MGLLEGGHGLRAVIGLRRNGKRGRDVISKRPYSHRPQPQLPSPSRLPCHHRATPNLAKLRLVTPKNRGREGRERRRWWRFRAKAWKKPVGSSSVLPPPPPRGLRHHSESL